MTREPMRRPFAIFSALALAAAPAFAAPGERFAVTFVSVGGSVFWDTFHAVAKAAAGRLDVDLEILDAKGDHLKMLDLAREVAARPVKPAYALVNGEKNIGGRLLEAMAAGGIPTLLVMNLLDAAEQKRLGPPRQRLPTFLGTLKPDNEGAGFALGQRLAEEAKARFPGQVELLAISGAKATPAASERDQGLRRALAGSPNLRLTQLVHSAWTREKAARQLTGLLRRWPATKAIWAANDPMALGACDALRARGAAPGRDALVVGLNWLGDALRLVKSGELVASAGGHFLGGAWALVLLRDHHDGLDFASEGLELQFPMGLVDEKNAAAVLSVLGDPQWNRVDFGSFSKARTPGLQRYQFTPARALEQLEQNR